MVRCDHSRSVILPALHRAALALATAGCLLGLGRSAQAELGGEPRAFVLDIENLERAKRAWQNGNPVMEAEMKRLISQCRGEVG